MMLLKKTFTHWHKQAFLDCWEVPANIPKPKLEFEFICLWDKFETTESV